MRAARESISGIADGWVYEQLCFSVPTGSRETDRRIREVFLLSASGPPRRGVMPDEDIAVHLWSVRGLARMGVDIPDGHDPSESEAIGWYLFDRLVASLETSPEDLPDVWRRIYDEEPASTINAIYQSPVGSDAWLVSIESVNRSAFSACLSGIRRSFDDFSSGPSKIAVQIERTREFDVDHPHNFVIPQPWGHRRTRDRGFAPSVSQRALSRRGRGESDQRAPVSLNTSIGPYLDRTRLSLYPGQIRVRRLRPSLQPPEAA